MEQVYGVYIRVSTDQQMQHGDSVEMQEDIAKEHIQSKEGILYKVYVEGGVSATKTELKNRKVLLECLNDAKQGLFNNLIVYKRDRLARTTEDSLAIRSILENANCSIHFTASGEQQMELNDPYAKLMENIHSSLAEIESAQISVRVGDTMYNKAKKGEFTGGNVTYGYENKNGYLVPIESEIPVIEEVVDMYLKGFGKNSIMKWLENEEVRNRGKRGVRAKKKLKQHKRSSEKWTIDTINAILFNKTYSGYLEYERKNKNGKNEKINVESEFIKPIRSIETQKKIDMLREKKNQLKITPRKYSTTFLLTGLLICGECGRDFSSRTVTKTNGKKYSYYICKGRHQNTSETCSSNSYKKDILEQFVLEEAKHYLEKIINSDVYSIIKSGLENNDKELQDKLFEVENQLIRAEKDFKSISRLLLDLDTEDDMYDMMKEMYQEQQKEVLMKINGFKQSRENLNEQLETKTEENINTSEIIKQLKQFNEVIETAPFHIQKQALETLFNRMEISKDGNVYYSLTIDFEEGEKEIDMLTIAKAQETRKGVVFNSGVGEPTPIKNLTLNSKEIIHSINFFEWLESLLDKISDSFYDFLIEKNSRLNSPTYFSRQTKISINTHRDYKKNKRVPAYENLVKCLDVAGSSIEEYVDFLKDEISLCSVKILKEVTSDANIIRRTIRRKTEAY